MDTVLKDELVQLMTVYVEPTSGQFYITWAPTVPNDWKLQFKAGFGSMFKEMPDG